MTQFKAYSPEVEVNGQTVLSIVDGMGSFTMSANMILSQNGIKDPKPGMWYLQQNWLNAFKEISEKLGPKTLLQIGKKIPEHADFPPQIDDIDKALAAIDVAYHMNHRNGEIGHYEYSKTGANSAKIVCNNPYPCDFDRGIILAMAQRFAPQDAHIRVEHEDGQSCRKDGSESCTYLITW